MNDSREVTRLRKAGQIQKALALARVLHRDDSFDHYNISAYGWALRDAITAFADSDMNSARQLVDEFNKLDLPNENEFDARLIAQREYYSGFADPSFQLIQKAKAKSKNQKYSEALHLYRQAITQSSQSKEACEGLAWELWRCLKNLPKDASASQITPLLREYGRLAAVEKPSEIHSRIMASATWYANKLHNYIPFVKWWNLENMRYEDRQKQYSEKNGKYFDSLAERVIKALHQAGKNHSRLSDFVWISKFIGDNYQKFPNQEWFPYYYGKALAKTGELETAREIVLPIVRAKQSEFWAWDVLASTYNDTESKKACLCKALLCKAKSDSFRVNVRCDLAALLKSEGALPEAKKEYLNAISAREKEGWKLTPELEKVSKEPWFSDTEIADNNSDLYREYVPIAESLLTKSLPWIDAVITGRRKGTDGKRPLLFIGTREGQNIEEVPINPVKFPSLKDLSEGMSVRIKMDSFGEKCIIVAAEPREGREWDIFPSLGGVVSHVNIDKGITRITTSKTGFCLLHFNKFPEAKNLSLGTFVGVKMRRDKKRNRNHAVSFRVIHKLPEGGDYFKSFTGEIRINDGNAFGFVNDYYVAPLIIKDLGLVDGDHVSGTGVCEWNQRKCKYSWSTITIKKTNK
jgi:hypothetical protein